MSDDKAGAAGGWPEMPADDATKVNPVVDGDTKPRSSVRNAVKQAAAKVQRPKGAASGSEKPATPASDDPVTTQFNPKPSVPAAPTTSLPKVPASAPAAAPVAPVVRPDPVRRTRKARLRLTRIDPWSVMKTAFLFSIAFGVMLWVSVYVVWSVIEASGLFDSVNNILNQALSSPGSATAFKLEDYLSTGRVLGYTAVLSVLNIVITTALATLFAFLYNLSATVLGGLEVTLAED